VIQLGKLKATFTLLKYFKTFFSARNSMNKLFKLIYIRLLEGLNLTKFLSTPRTVEEIRNKIGEVKNEEFFQTFISILLDLVAVKIDNKIVLSKEKINKILSYRNDVVVREFEVLYEAGKDIFPEMFKAIIRNIPPRYDWEYTMVVNFSQHSADIYKKGREIVLNFANAKSELKGKTILDLSAGFGYEVEHLIKYFNGNIKIVVAAISEKMLNLAKKYEFDYNGKKISLEEAEQVIDFILIDPNVEKPWPFKDKEFDGVLAYSLIHWIPNQKAFINEVSRVLKTGRQFLGFSIFYEEVPKWADFFIKIQGGNRFLTFKEFDKMCIEAGFEKPRYFGKLAFKTRKIR